MTGSKIVFGSEEVLGYLESFAPIYPGIQDWGIKVFREVRRGKRTIIGIVDSGRLVGLAITKNSRTAKLCHLSVQHSYRGLGWGELLLRSAISSMLVRGALRIHVTTSDEVAEGFGGFFSRYGFELHSWEKGRYRKEADELVWVAHGFKLTRRLSMHGPICETREPVRSCCPHQHTPVEWHAELKHPTWWHSPLPNSEKKAASAAQSDRWPMSVGSLIDLAK